jgi:hypothetical protein
MDAGVVLVRLTYLAERLRDSWKATCRKGDDLAVCYENELILGYVPRELVDLGYMPRKRDDSYILNTKNQVEKAYFKKYPI